MRKVIKINQEEIIAIIGEYFNDSKNKFISNQVFATRLNILGKANDDLRLVCILSDDAGDEDIFKIDLIEIDKNYDFTGERSVELKNKKI